nr:hypothetical protein [Tanacetum cinerariifolium]
MCGFRGVKEMIHEFGYEIPLMSRLTEGKPQKYDKGFIDSGCSRHMTGNIAYLLDFKEFDGESLTYLASKATLDESLLWHRRLGHIIFKNINKLVQDNLVRGLPIKCFENDQTCVASLKGKQHRASSTKDETSEILKNFIKEIENLVDKKVKIIRYDNGIKFKNKVMDDFGREKVKLLGYTTLEPERMLKMVHIIRMMTKKSEDDSSPKEVNAVGQHVNTASLKVNTGHFELNTVDTSLNTASSSDLHSPTDMFKLGANDTLKGTHVEFYSDRDA